MGFTHTHINQLTTHVKRRSGLSSRSTLQPTTIINTNHLAKLASAFHAGKNKCYMVEPKTQPGPETFPVVRFDEREQQIIKHIAAIRDRTYDPIDGGQTHGKQSRYDAHRTGVMGEAAVTKFLDGLNFHDMNVMFPFGDEGHDLVIRGKTVDVKATKTNLSIPDLIVPESPRPSADWFILVHVLGEDSARLIGMAQLDVVLDHDIRQAPGERRNYWIPPEDLVLFTR